MYALHVFHPGEDTPREVERLTRAADVLSRIPLLLVEHHGCEKVAVFFHTTLLFSVDCQGNTQPGS